MRRFFMTCLVVFSFVSLAAPVFISPAPPTSSSWWEERQLTFDTDRNHQLDNNLNWSPDSKWLAYDTRAFTGGIGNTLTLEKVNIDTKNIVVMYKAPNALPLNGFGPGTAAVSFFREGDAVIAIRGLDGVQYADVARFGAIISPTNGTVGAYDFFVSDARDVTPPFTRGALRGGTHRHEPSGDGKWIGFTYNDEIMKALGKNLRTIGVIKPGTPVDVDAALGNQDGLGFSVLLVKVKPQAEIVPGSNDISNAADDSWVGEKGYQKPDGTWQRARAFIGRTVTAAGADRNEVYIVDFPEDITVAGPDGPLEGTATTFPMPPKGTVQRRLTWSDSNCGGIIRCSRDGSRIAFTRDGQIWLISPLGGAPVQATSIPTGASKPVWDPSGDFIYCVSDNSIWRTNVSEGDAHFGESMRITDPTLYPGRSPDALCVAPDGQWIAFNRSLNRGDNVFVNQVFLVRAYSDANGDVPQFTAWTVPFNLGMPPNTEWREGGACISKDGLSLYYNINSSPGGFGGADLYVSRRASVNHPWGEPQNLGPNINGPGNEQTAMLSLDGKRLYFASDRSGGLGGLDLYVSQRDSSANDLGWKPPVNLGSGANSNADDIGPGLFEDSKTGAVTLYFGSSRPGGLGGYDIYASTLKPDGTFGPAALMRKLSSTANDQRPALRWDGLEIFFDSTRAGGEGATDIWVATRRDTSDPWSAPINLGPAINTPSLDARPALSYDGTTLYFHSGGHGGYGDYDLIVSTRTNLTEQPKEKPWSILNTVRTPLPASPGDIVHYRFDVVMGTGVFDVMQVHRVVREGRPNRPIQTADAVFLVPGAPQNFEQIFIPPTIASAPKWDQSFAVYLAKNDVDVWGITYGWALVPSNIRDFAFMKGWGIEKDSQYTDIALSMARSIRSSSGPDFGPLHLVGFSYGAYIAYSLAGEETQRPNYLRNVKSIIPVDSSLKYPPGSKLQKACCQSAKDDRAALNAGKYQTDATFFSQIAQLARSQPDAPSPIPDFAGLTNYQAALALGMFYGFVGGISDNGIPKDLLYTDAKLWIDLLATAPPYLPSQIYFDIHAAGCGSDEFKVSFYDHLRQIAVPILYVGAGGGEGEAGYFTTEQTASTDVMKFTVSRADVPYADFAHGDLFLAKNAEKWLWNPILLWIQAHRQ